MEYVTTIKFEGMFIPIFVDDIVGVHAVTTNLFTHYGRLKSKYQIVLDRDLLDKEDDFVKYVFNHELGHIHLLLKIDRDEIDGTTIGLINHELFADIYSLKSIDKYNLDFIEYLFRRDDYISMESKINYNYIKKFIKRNIYNNIYDILTINFTGIL